MKILYGHGKVHLADTEKSQGGLFVIYQDLIKASQSDDTGHDDLLEALAAQYHLDKSTVHFSGIRGYFCYRNGNILVSGVKEADAERLERDLRFYGRILLKALS